MKPLNDYICVSTNIPLLKNVRLSLFLMLYLLLSELRERIQPEILELIKQQRLNRLCEGSCFRKLGNRRRQGTYTINKISTLFTAEGAPLLLIIK